MLQKRFLEESCPTGYENIVTYKELVAMTMWEAAPKTLTGKKSQLSPTHQQAATRQLFHKPVGGETNKKLYVRAWLVEAVAMTRS
jgi:hypothetical protein